VDEEPDGPDRTPDARAPHEPVLRDEVVRLLGGDRVVIDATLGAGGHAEALLEAGVRRVIGIDRDPSARELAAGRLSRFGERISVHGGLFSEVLAEMAESRAPVGGILLDLGVSSMQLDRADRGFSYRQGGPLDMRMGPEGLTAASIVNETPEEELADIIYELGGERRSRRVAAAIVRARSRHPIETTDELARIVAGAVGSRRGGAHPARRTFQALRLAVNDELEELQRALPLAVRALAPGGRLVVIAYHSLEDRIVKRFFAEATELEVITRKPVRPTTGEVEENPRARSARLRAAERRGDVAA
jgi:16S rRNA (cytosine1402-N4)-methyltransferase